MFLFYINIDLLYSMYSEADLITNSVPLNLTFRNEAEIAIFKNPEAVVVSIHETRTGFVGSIKCGDHDIRTRSNKSRFRVLNWIGAYFFVIAQVVPRLGVKSTNNLLTTDLVDKIVEALKSSNTFNLVDLFKK